MSSIEVDLRLPISVDTRLLEKFVVSSMYYFPGFWGWKGEPTEKCDIFLGV